MKSKTRYSIIYIDSYYKNGIKSLVNIYGKPFSNDVRNVFFCHGIGYQEASQLENTAPFVLFFLTKTNFSWRKLWIAWPICKRSQFEASQFPRCGVVICGGIKI